MGYDLNRHLPSLAACGLALGLCSATTQAAHSLDSCGGRIIASLPAVVSTQGTWCLNKDLATSISSGSAIRVAANNVTIDCNDFKLGGAAAGAATFAIGIAVTDQVGVTIRNCNIRGFHRGIWLDGGANTLVENNVFFGNTVFGIGVQNVDSAVIRNNRIMDTGNAPDASPGGIVVISGSAAVISDNVVSGVVANPGFEASAWGIRDESVGSTLSGNRIFNVAGAGPGRGSGILLGAYGKAIGNTIDSIIGNQAFGIECSFPSAAQSNITSRVESVTPISGCVDGDGNASL